MEFRMFNRLGLFILVFSFVVGQGFSVPLENLISIDRIRQLESLEQGLIVETQLRNPVPRLMPLNNEFRQLVDGIMNSLNPNTIAEVLFLYSKPEEYHTSYVSWDNEQKTGIFNQILAISTLTGIQYYSASRNAMRTFYEFSGVIDGPQTKNPLPDPFYSQLPETLTLYARQKDLTFGENIYRYNYINTTDAVFFTQENVTAMRLGIIPAIGRGNLQSVFAIIDCGDTILVYAISMARAASLPGMGDRVSNSITNRATAVLNWLSGRLNNELFVN